MGILTGSDLHEVLVIAQRVRICELEYELRQARDLATRTQTDVTVIRDHVGKLLVTCLPPESLKILTQALDVVAGNVTTLRDQLHVAVTRPIDRAPELLPANVVPIRRVQQVGKLGPWRQREEPPPLLPPALGITAVHDDWSTGAPPSSTANPTE